MLARLTLLLGWLCCAAGLLVWLVAWGRLQPDMGAVLRMPHVPEKPEVARAGQHAPQVTDQHSHTWGRATGRQGTPQASRHVGKGVGQPADTTTLTRLANQTHHGWQHLVTAGRVVGAAVVDATGGHLHRPHAAHAGKLVRSGRQLRPGTAPPPGSVISTVMPPITEPGSVIPGISNGDTTAQVGYAS